MNEIDQLRAQNKELLEVNKLLKDELKRKNSLIENLPCSISWITSDLEYLAINKNLEEILDIEKGALKDKKVGFLEGDSNPFYQFIKNFFNSSQSFDQVEYTAHTTRDQKRFLIMAQKYNGDKEAIVVGFDITDKYLLQEKLNTDARMRTIAEISTGIIHEIKNPLCIIKSCCELLELKVDQYDKSQRLSIYEKIDLMSDRINLIIDGLKNLARDHSQEIKEITKLSKIIDEAIMVASIKIKKYGIDFQIKNTTSSSTSLNCIEGEIIQVLVNLLGNACEAASENEQRWVKLNIQEEEDLIKIDVIDSGKGIKQEVLSQMFKPFFTTKPKEIGTGMGLGICEEITLNHGGELKYKLEQGHTAFELTFPK